MTAWDPAQYRKFSSHRLRPALDLLAAVPLEAPSTIFDMGCGEGRVTALLAVRWPEAAIVGVDDSESMLAVAARELPGVTLRHADIRSWRPTEPVDLIFSNAALHWLPDHARLFPDLLRWLRPGGVLAVQMPRNFDAPSHTAITEAVTAGPWRDKLIPLLRHAPVARPEEYHGWLAAQAPTPANAPAVARLDIWETTYLQQLEGENPVAEWTRGTWLKPFLDALEGADRDAFLADYSARVAAAYPRGADGRTLFPFRRIFVVAALAGVPRSD